MGLFNESNQGRFNQLIARLHDIKGNPAPQVEPEIGHNVQIAATNIDHSLDALVGLRNCFAAVTGPAQGVGISSGVDLNAASATIVQIYGVQVNKATAGFVSVQYDDIGSFTGTFSAVNGTFFRDTRFGKVGAAKPATKAFVRATGGLPASTVFKRVQVAAGLWTPIPFNPAFVIAWAPGTPQIQFGVFNETLNEALDVMIDFSERAASPSELALPQ